MAKIIGIQREDLIVHSFEPHFSQNTITSANPRATYMGLAYSGIMPPMKYWEIVADKLSAAAWS